MTLDEFESAARRAVLYQADPVASGWLLSASQFAEITAAAAILHDESLLELAGELAACGDRADQPAVAAAWHRAAQMARERATARLAATQSGPALEHDHPGAGGPGRERREPR